MKITKKRLLEHLAPMKYINEESLQYEGESVEICTHNNCLFVEPLTVQAERNIRKNPFTHILHNSKHCFALFYFPVKIKEILEAEMLHDYFFSEKLEKFFGQLSLKYRSRFENLLKAEEEGQIRLSQSLVLSSDELLSLKYTAKQYEERIDDDYRDNQEDTACKALATTVKNYETIERVSTSYNTFLILQDAKKNKNKSLFRYLHCPNAFYCYCAINYILLHSQIATAENFKYPNPINEVHMPAKELFKLFPHRNALVYMKSMRDIVKISFNRKGKRLSKKDTVTLIFSDEYLTRLKHIILRTDENKTSPNSFVKIPIFFILEALKADNLGSKGYQFLLWLIPFFRMSEPKILHSVKTIMKETGMDTKHGYNKPLAILQKYFEYLFELNMLVDVNEPIDLNPEAKQLKLFNTKEVSKLKKLTEAPLYNNKPIQLRKPKKPKEA